MTRDQWLDCVRALQNEMHLAEVSGDPDRMQGVAMAVEAFLSIIEPSETPNTGPAHRANREEK